MLLRSIVIIFLLLQFLKCYAQNTYEEINTNSEVISVSDFAKEGKISVFVIATDYCAGCKVLLKRLVATTDVDFSYVDMYYVNIQSGMDSKTLENTPGYYFWRKIERVEEFPTLYVTAPTRNVVKKYSQQTLIEEAGLKKIDTLTTYKKTLDIIERLTPFCKRWYSPNEILKEPYLLKTNKNNYHYTYKVKRGDTLFKIAEKYKTTVESIANLNKIENPSKIQKGTELHIDSEYKIE